MNEEQLKLLWSLHAEKDGGFKDYNEFKSLMANDNARKAYFDASNSQLGFKNYGEFNSVLEKKNPSDTGSDASGGSSAPSAPASPNVFDPNTFMQESRAAVLSKPESSDAQNTQQSIQHQVVKNQTKGIQTNQANAKIASPVTGSELVGKSGQ